MAKRVRALRWCDGATNEDGIGISSPVDDAIWLSDSVTTEKSVGFRYPSESEIASWKAADFLVFARTVLMAYELEADNADSPRNVKADRYFCKSHHREYCFRYITPRPQAVATAIKLFAHADQLMVDDALAKADILCGFFLGSLKHGIHENEIATGKSMQRNGDKRARAKREDAWNPTKAELLELLSNAAAKTNGRTEAIKAVGKRSYNIVNDAIKRLDIKDHEWLQKK